MPDLTRKEQQTKFLRNIATIQGKLDQRTLDCAFIGMIRGSVELADIHSPQYIADMVAECVTIHRDLSREVSL